MGSDARAGAAAVLALAPRQPGQCLLLRRVRRLHQAAALEGVLVRFRRPGGDRALRCALRRTPGDPGGARMSNAWSAPPVLQGRHARLEPLRAEHADGIAAAAADGKLWELWFTSVPKPEEVGTWLET